MAPSRSPRRSGTRGICGFTPFFDEPLERFFLRPPLDNQSTRRRLYNIIYAELRRVQHRRIRPSVRLGPRRSDPAAIRRIATPKMHFAKLHLPAPEITPRRRTAGAGLTGCGASLAISRLSRKRAKRGAWCCSAYDQDECGWRKDRLIRYRIKAQGCLQVAPGKALKPTTASASDP